MAVNKLQLKRSAVAGKEPTTSSLALGELAINTLDGKVFLKKDNGVETIVQLADVSGSILSASYAQTSSHSNNFTVTGPVNVYGSQYISGSLVVGNDITAQRLIVQTITSSVIYSSGSNIFGDATSDTQTFTGSVNISGSLNLVGNQSINAGYELDVDSINVNTITDRSGGTLTLGASTSSVSGFLTVNNNISSSGKIEAVSFTGSFSGSLNNLQGTPTHIPYFSSSQVLANSAMLQSTNNFSIAINQDAVTSGAPEALYVWQPSDTSYNVISGKGNLNNYLQLNIQNTNQGVSASSDVVATANNGDETTNFIDMGINSQNFSGPVGGPNDAYLYATGQNLHIGNATPGQPIQFFAGGTDADVNRKLQLSSNDQHQMTGSLDVTSQVLASKFVTRNATAAQFVKGDGSLDSTVYVSSSIFNVTTGSLNNFSASVLLATASIYNATASLYNATASIYNTTASLYAYTASNNNVVAQLYATTASLKNATESLYRATASLYNATASLYNFSASILAYTASQNVLNGTYATTGSNIFKGNQVISGSLTVSGSTNIFGTTNLTGSVNVSGSTGTAITANIDTIVFTGSYAQSGSVSLTSSVDISGSLTVQGRNYINDSSSFSIRTFNLEQTSASVLLATASLYRATASIYNATASIYNTTASLYAYTASNNDVIAQLYNETASLRNATASIYLATASLYNATASIYNTTESLYNFSASINAYTSSNNDIIAQLYAETASLKAATASINLATESLYNATASIYNTTASLYEFSASINAYTSSNNDIIAQLYATTSSLKNATASLYNATASIYNATASLYAASASINAFSASILSYTASQNILNGTFATTASNTFYGTETVSGSVLVSGSIALQGDQNIVGNLTVTNTITAQKLVVQTISSSVIFSSGSNKFGDELTDVQSFTGSVEITGSLTVNGRNYINDSSSFSTRTLNLEQTSASVLLATASIYSATASLYNATASIYLTTASLYEFSASMNSYTASTNATIAQIQNATASIYNATASIYLATESLNRATASIYNTTASLYTFSASINAYTASNNNIIAQLYNETASLKAATASINLATESLNRATSSLYNATASIYNFSASILNYTASTNATIAQIQNATASLYAASASINAYTASNNEAISDIRVTTASLYAFSASINAYTASNNATIAQIQNATASIYNATASLYAASASINAFTASQLVLNGKYATTGSNVFRGNQTVTGSLFTSGSNTLVGSTTLTGSLNVSGSTTQTGNNTLIGNTLLSGSLIVSGSQGLPTATIGFFGDVDITGTVGLLPVSANINSTLSGSYIYVSGSTQDLYFTQNGNGRANTTRLRWLEGNLYTGLLNGGLITVTTGSTTFNLSSGSGIIVDLGASINDNPYPTIKYINWNSFTNVPLTYLTSSIQTFVGIDNTGNIFQQTTAFNNGQYNTLISIGTVLHQNKSTVNASITYPNVSYGWKQRSYDFVKAFGPLKLSGLTIATSSSLGLTVGSGTAFADGRNYQVDPNNPSYINDPGTTVSKIFRYWQSGSEFVQDTNAGAGYTTIDPTQYNDGTALISVSPATPWTNQRVFWYPNSATKGIVVYYGRGQYASSTEALANLNTETFLEVENTKQNAVYLGSITIKYNGIFTTPADYIISPAGIFRSVGGSGGGGTVVTTRLIDLSDVAAAGATSGQALVYDSTAAKWSNKSFISASISGNAATATTASFAVTASNAITASSADNFLVRGTLTAQNIVVQTITSSVDFVTGSTRFGTLSSNTHQFTGSVSISGSLDVTAGVVNSLTSSYAVNADLLDGLDSTSFVSTGSFGAETASFNAFSASINAYTASNNTTIQAIYAETASLQAATASLYAATASINEFTASINSYTASAKIDSGSVSTRLVNLEAFSSSLDSTFATDADLNALSSSFIAHTASINAFSASMNAYTASNNTTIQALYAETASLQAATASLYSFSSSINAYTASNNGTIAQLYAETASILAHTASINAFSASINAYTSSNNNAITSIYNATASLNAFSASILNYTSSTNATISDIQLATASLYAATASIYNTTQSLSASIGLLSSSFLAFSGSYNTGSFSGSLVGTASWATNSVTASSADDFLVRGTLTAQTIVVQTITSSVDFVTGSTHFGTIDSNTHQFTGSVSVSGSLAVNGSNVILTNQTSSMSVLNAQTASYWSGSIVNAATASFVQNAQSASYWSGSITNALSASYAATASYWSGSIFNVVSASFAQLARSASFAETASFALNAGSGGGGGLSALYIQDEGITQGTASYIDFVGNGVTATVSNGTASINIPGGAGSSQAGGNAILTQSVANVTWSFTHNLNTQFPVFTIFDSNNDVIIPNRINAVNTSSALIYFSSPRTGYAVASQGGNVTSASYALVAVSASYASTASFASTASYVTLAQSASYWSGSINNALSASYAATASYADNFTVAGTLTAQTLVVQTITSSVVYSSGSNVFGNDLANTQILTGSVTITGSLAVNGSNVVLTNQTASMSVSTASFASTASFTPNAIVSAVTDFPLYDTIEFTLGNGTISTVTINNVGTASLANTASYWSGSIVNAQTASFVQTAQTASYVTLAQTASYWSGSIQNAVSAAFADFASSASYSLTASYAANGGGGGISAISIADEGILQGQASYFDFTGAGVSVAVASNTASFTITGGGSSSGTAGLTTTFTQSLAATTWSFNHSLNTRFPLVQVYDTSFNQVQPQYISSSNASTVEIGFGVATAGYAVASMGGTLSVTGSNVVYSQTSAATTWSFAHNLNNQYPIFQVFDTNNEVVVPEKIIALSATSSLIYFPTPVAGKAVASIGGMSGSAGSGAGFPFSGSAVITGSFLVSGSSVDFTQVASFTGNLNGTASYASNFPAYTVRFTQSVAATTWSFVHSLNTRNPIVQVYGSDFKQLMPNDIVGVDNNTVEVRFDYAESGYAVLSNGGGLYVTGSTSTLIQSSAATTWSFTHNLNSKYPNFEVYDDNDYVIIPAGIKAIDNNSAELYFATSQSGRAIANFSGIDGSANALSASYASSGSNLVVTNTVRLDQSLMDYASVNSSIVGSNNLYTQATGSYTSAFFNYTVANGANARSGQVIAVWYNNTASYTDVSTADIGDTSAVTASVSVVTGNAQFNVQTNSSGWRIKSTATFM